MARNRILVNPQNPNGIEVPFTAAEETQADTDASEAIVRKQAEADAKVAQEATDTPYGGIQFKMSGGDIEVGFTATMYGIKT